MTLDYQSVGGEITNTYQYNALGHRTLSIDPAGRVFTYTYAGNGIDLTQITETQNNDSFMLGNWTYSNHRPTQYIDGSARTWGYSYNGAGQITSMTDPNSNTTSMTYTGTSSAFLTQINGPLSGNNDITTFFLTTVLIGLIRRRILKVISLVLITTVQIGAHRLLILMELLSRPFMID